LGFFSGIVRAMAPRDFANGLALGLLCIGPLLQPGRASAAGMVVVSTGGSHSCAVDRQTGVVSCWGEGINGQLGDNRRRSSTSAVEVLGIDSAVAVSAGGQHSCAVETSGTVKCWGAGHHGQLGHGGLSGRPVAHPVPGLSSAVDVSAGGSHTCGLEQTGIVKCWGWGDHGQLGQGARSRSRYAVEVAELQGAVSISAGGLHSCAVTGNWTVWCWGYAAAYTRSQHGAVANAAAPTLVPWVADAVSVVCGYEHTCAMLRDGGVTCWGRGVDLDLQDETDIWNRTSRQTMKLGEAVSNSFWPSPLGAAW